MHVWKEKGVRCSREPAILTVSYQEELGVAQTSPYMEAKRCTSLPCQPGHAVHSQSKHTKARRAVNVQR